MWWLLVVLGCGTAEVSSATLSESAPTAPTALKDFKNASVAELKIAVEGGAKVIDVRNVDEYAAGHVPGAKLIPLDQLDPLDPSFAGYTKEETLYVICAVGGRSRQAATKLAAAGYNVVNVEGGTNGWKGAGYPVE